MQRWLRDAVLREVHGSEPDGRAEEAGAGVVGHALALTSAMLNHINIPGNPHRKPVSKPHHRHAEDERKQKLRPKNQLVFRGYEDHAKYELKVDQQEANEEARRTCAKGCN